MVLALKRNFKTIHNFGITNAPPRNHLQMSTSRPYNWMTFPTNCSSTQTVFLDGPFCPRSD